jgi:hypothetical protein
VDKLLEYLNQVAELQNANPNFEIPWAKQAKERAADIEKDRDRFVATVRKLYQAAIPAPKLDPIAPKKN